MHVLISTLCRPHRSVPRAGTLRLCEAPCAHRGTLRAAVMAVMQLQAALLLGLGLAASPMASASTSSEKPHVLMIVIDDLGVSSFRACRPSPGPN